MTISYGQRLDTGDDILLDPPPNALFLGSKGTGRSFLAKVLLRRLRAEGIGSLVLDATPGGEHGRIAALRGGRSLVAGEGTRHLHEAVVSSMPPMSLSLQLGHLSQGGTSPHLLAGPEARDAIGTVLGALDAGAFRDRPTVMLLDSAWPFLVADGERLAALVKRGPSGGLVTWCLGTRPEDFARGWGSEVLASCRTVFAFPLQPSKCSLLPRGLDEACRESGRWPVGTFSVVDTRFPGPVLGRLKATPEEMQAVHA